MWKLRFISDVDGANVIDLIEAGITIGRDPENILCIEHTSLSKFHAVLVRNGSDYKIFDVHSTNGTYVNGQRITFASLRNGDKVRLGNIELEYESAVKRAMLRPQLGGAAESPKPVGTPTIVQEPGSGPTVPAKVSVPGAPSIPAKPAPSPVPAPVMAPPVASTSAEVLTSVPPPPPAEAKAFIRTTPSTTQNKKSTSSSSKNIMSKLGIGQSAEQPAPVVPHFPSVPPPVPSPAPATVLAPKPPVPQPQPQPAVASQDGAVVIAKRPAGKLTIGGGASTDDAAGGGGRKKIIITPRQPQG